MFQVGNGVLHHGDVLKVLPTFDDESFDATIADPPYCSGGRTHNERLADPSKKYCHSSTGRYASFMGETRDQRSWGYWCSLWLSECWRITRPMGYVLCFVDWRQLPTLTNAMQAAGWIWRGILSWDKTEAARSPHTGYFRHQAEFVVWGTKGSCRRRPGEGPWPGVLRQRVDTREKCHVAGKPTELLKRLVTIVPQGGVLLDPFVGSGTGPLAAEAKDRQWVGIEMDPHWYQVAADRLRLAAATAARKAA
ncbi:Modification methylase DpnIIB [Planctomycetes bacterium Pan216]|uniref:Methyltransferase n=1 Tax=Kolteria novifilia TaxID=2527975 RepID=A0A518B5A3_9BACT|nr:Modification methylase DpnIIB [Planctomycetes bacterium Pan216]